jgi:MFS family permease
VLSPNDSSSSAPLPNRSWITVSVIGIVLATFLSDFSHEMCTAVLPLYLSALGLGPAALGLIEGVADFLVSMSKLAGGVVGHHVRHKRPLVSIGYLTTALATWGIAFVHGLAALVSLRSVAWIGRGFRGPLRDYMLADAVPPTHYGRAYGLERAGDMLGAVVGPLIATLLVWGGVEFRTVILWTLVPGLLAAASIFFLTRERERPGASGSDNAPPQSWRSFPRAFWVFLIGVLFFGLGDFSRTFLIWLAAQRFDGPILHEPGTVSLAILLYTVHNLVSAGVAYPVGHMGDRSSKLHILLWGYGLGVATNVLLAFLGGSIIWLIAVFVLSGSYIAVEETLEKAVAAEMLPRELRNLGFGLLAFANAGGDMISSLYVGYLLGADRPGWAFSIAATVGMVGVVWLLLMRHRLRPGLLKVS